MGVQPSECLYVSWLPPSDLHIYKQRMVHAHRAWTSTKLVLDVRKLAVFEDGEQELWKLYIIILLYIFIRTERTMIVSYVHCYGQENSFV